MLGSSSGKRESGEANGLLTDDYWKFLIIRRFLYLRRQLSLIYWSSGRFKKPFPFYYPSTRLSERSSGKSVQHSPRFDRLLRLSLHPKNSRRALEARSGSRAAKLVSDRWENQSDGRVFCLCLMAPSNKNSLGSSGWLHRHPHPL